MAPASAGPRMLLPCSTLCTSAFAAPSRSWFTKEGTIGMDAG